MSDWLAILREQKKTARGLEREAKKILANPAIQPEQARTLFDALEEQAVFVEKLRKVLDGVGHEPDVVKAAEGLEELYGELAAEVAERLTRMPR